MMNNKLEKLAIFFTYVVIILFGLSIAAFIFKELFSYKYIAELSKNHGSLIAGLIGFGGVLMLIWHQDKTTKKILDSNLMIIRNEAFEIHRAEALGHLVSVSLAFDDILTNHKDQRGSLRSMAVEVNKFKVAYSHLEVFIQRYDKGNLAIIHVIDGYVQLLWTMLSAGEITSQVDNKRMLLFSDLLQSYQCINFPFGSGVDIHDKTWSDPKTFITNASLGKDWKDHMYILDYTEGYIRHYVLEDIKQKIMNLSLS